MVRWSIIRQEQLFCVKALCQEKWSVLISLDLDKGVERFGLLIDGVIRCVTIRAYNTFWGRSETACPENDARTTLERCANFHEFEWVLALVDRLSRPVPNIAQRECEHCEETFQPLHPAQRFCKDKCRLAACRQRKKEVQHVEQ